MSIEDSIQYANIYFCAESNGYMLYGLEDKEGPFDTYEGAEEIQSIYLNPNQEQE